MAKNVEHVSHIKSKLKTNGLPQLPTADKLVDGEIAINYAEGVETISIRNENSAITTFSSDNYYTEKKLGSGFTNNDATVTEAIDDLEYMVVNKEEAIAAALNDLNGRKLDASAYTPTDLSDYYKKSETSGKTEISNALGGKVNTATFTGHTADTSLHFSGNEKRNLDALATNIESISGITSNDIANWNAAAGVDMSKYYKKTETSGSTELSTAFSNKADSSALTTHTSNATIHITSAERTAWNAKADISDIPSVSSYADSVQYNSTTKKVEFYHGTTAGTKVFEYDASPFLIDGMVQNVEIKNVTSGGSQVTCLVVSFNTDSGKQDINIPISQIFDANNYYTTAQTSGATELQTAFNGKTDTATTTALNNAVTAHTANTNIHLTTTEKGQLHTHTNKTALDSITGNVGTMAYQATTSYSSATQVNTALGNKVDKVSGKGLSTNDYTTDEKNKLSGIASGAQVNVIETVKVNGTALTPSSKAVNMTVPTKTSELTNDSNFVSDASYVHTDNNYTTAEKNKLAGIAAGAEVNVQSDWNATSGDAFIKNKPTIPAEVTESTVSGWGFTKNEGTITGIKMNGSSKGTSGVVDLGTVITAHQDISGKVDKTTTVNGHALSGNVSVTKSDVGLGNVGNFKAVSTVASQGLTDTEKANARANIGAGTSSFSGSYNDLSNKPTIPEAAANGTYTVKTLVGSTTTNVSDFTANQSSADDVTFVQGSNVTITPDATNRKITIAAKDTTYSAATSAATGLMSAEDKKKLDGIASGAEVNQNAFSNIKVGSTTVAADSKTDTLEIVGSGIITVSTDATNDKITISASNAVTSVAGKTGAVTLAKGDVGLGNVDNTADANKTVKAATSAATADTAKAVALSGVTNAEDLKAIEALTGTSGLLKKTAANTWSLDTNSYSTTAVAVTGATYNSTNKTIDLKNAAGTVVSTVDATAFIKDGMVSNVEVKNVASSGTCLVITFNTDAGKDAINIPISQIFDANNYYTKADLTGSSTTVVVAKASSATTAASAGSVALSNVTGADDLKAIEALTGTSGLLKKTAANTWTLDTTDYSNKNAFGKIKINAESTTIDSDTTNDTLTISGGSFVTLTSDAANDKFTIGVSTGTSSSTLARGDHNHDSAYQAKGSYLTGTTKYAGSSSQGGAATSAEKLSNTSAIGSVTNPVFFTANGVPSACTYSLNKTVPSNAVFTDTDTKVTAVGNHYTPSATSADTKSATASSTSELNWGSAVVTGVTLSGDAKGHITSVTVASGKLKTPVTGVTLASGTNNGTVKLTVNGSATDNIAVKGLGSMAYQATSSYSSATEVNTALSGKSNIGHTHDDRYYTESELTGSSTTVVVAKAASATTAASAGSVAWGNVSGKPSSFTPSAHDQASNTITAMTGYAIASASGAVATNDTLNAAVGKLEKRIALLEAALGGMKLVKLTQTQYDALPTKDSNTLYVISD